MASRRTRIKGIAHIPQRRKTVNNGTNPEELTKTSPEIDQIVPDEHNLNQKHEISPDGQKAAEICSELKKDEITENPPTIVVNGDSKPPPSPTSKMDTDGCSETPEKPKAPDPVPEITKNLTQNNTLNQKPAVPIRRKFIKPTVSVSAINRKPKENEDVKEAKSIVVNNPVNGKSNKIVILNEIISYANQNQHVVIKPEISDIQENQDHLLKPPEVNFGKTINSLEKEIKRPIPNGPQLLAPDIEYPIPPPSPNKMNRSRIKAVPRLGQRNTSFSASESEDESRRNYRHRNDSVCSSASGLLDTNSISECLSPQKPKEFNSVIQRKCRRTEQSRKLAEARRDFYLKFGNKKPDRQKLTMIDLIFYNPVTNPMTSENKNKRKNSETESENTQEAKIQEEVVDDPGKTGSDEENEIPAPQIKIGPEGELIVDEQSLVIENKKVKKTREEIENSQVVNGDSETNYGVYKRAKRSKDWSKQETLKFYKALNTIGTDFTLMCELFPRRSRRELKMKFKKEERVNKVLVDKAIMQPCGFDFNDFKHEVDMEEKELQEIENQKEREKVLKQEAKKRKAAGLVKTEPAEKQAKVEKPKTKKKRTLDIMDVLEDDSDADESEVESVEDGLTEDSFLQSIQKPTRSGRVPKMLNRYKAPEPEGKDEKAKPGSLILLASTGPNGQPVYKVCMITSEHGRQQIGNDMSSLKKAIECKENGITSLFTISTSTNGETNSLQNNESTPMEETNITIPAEENDDSNHLVIDDSLSTDGK